MNDIALRQDTVLSIQPGQTEFNEAQIATLHQMGVVNADRGNLAVLFHQAARTGLDPFSKQLYMIARKTKEWDPEVREMVTRTKWTIQTGIDGYRLLARRGADRANVPLSFEDTLWCGPDGEWHDAWIFQNPPVAAKVTVRRGKEKYSAVALYMEYVQTYYNKEAGKHVPNSMWQKMPANQLGKCAEAAALRKAFPVDLSGLYIDEEMPSPTTMHDDSVLEEAEEQVTVHARETPIRTQPMDAPDSPEKPEDTDVEVPAPDPEPESEPYPVTDSGPGPEPGPEPEPSGDVPMFQETYPEPSPTAPEPNDDGGPCTREQQNAVVTMLKSMGCNSKEKANSIMSKFCGRPITKSADLTYAEAQRFTAGVES